MVILLRAIELYDRALASEPNNTNAITNKGLALARSGNTTAAIKAYTTEH